MKKRFVNQSQSNSIESVKKAFSYFLTVLILSLLGKLHAEKEPNPRQEIFSYDRLITIRNPEKSPPAIPRFLVPAEAKLLLSSDLRSNFYSSFEAFLVLEIETEKKEVEEYYEKAMQSREWKLLQSDTTQDKTIFLSEGFSRKVITVLIYKLSDTKTKVKLFYKKANTY